MRKNIREAGFAPIVLLLVAAVAGLVFLKQTGNLGNLQTSKQTALTTPSVNKATKQTEAKQTNTALSQNLEKYLTVEAALLGVSDNISLYFKDLNQGKEISIDPTRSWIPASTIKTYVVLEAFRQRDLGLINFSTPITIKADNVVPTELETDEFPRLREGTTATIRQLIEAMIIQSDNTAYNTLIDVLDRRNINLALKNLAITETVVGEKLNLDDSQFQQDLQVPGRQPNTTTVKDLATFFDLLYSKKIADSDEILAIFKRQKINNMIPALLPQATQIAHKTGDWAPIYHDGGVIFKQDNPFILTVFTSSGDPSIVAKLAQVAYYQNADYVGKSLGLSNGGANANQQAQNRPIISLAQLPDQNVLAEESNNKFPTITAADLGITPKDLNFAPQEAKDLNGALITPGSLLYKLKTLIQNNQVQESQSNSAKARVYIGLAKDRLSEVKTLLNQKDLSNIDSLLSESENYLAKATELAKNDPDKDLLLVEIKQANDLHFAVLNDRANTLSGNQKEQFIDSVYNFYKKDTQDVKPTVNTSVIANPLQQKPAIGTVTEVKDNQATVNFDDGSSKQVILSGDTKVKVFQGQTFQNPNSIITGDKIAIIGLTNSDSKIVPEFILKDVPKELPSEHKGTVIEVNPGANTIKILDNKGQQQTVNIGSDTEIKSKDTNVSLEGIKAGSQVTVFGIDQAISATQPLASGQSQSNLNSLPIFGISPTPSVSLSPQPSSNPSATLAPGAKSSTSRRPSSGNSSLQVNPSSVNSSSKPSALGPKTTSPGAPAPTRATNTTNTSSQGKNVELKATSITITVNSSGKNEVRQKAPTAPQAPAKPSASAPKQQSKPAPHPTKH